MVQNSCHICNHDPPPPPPLPLQLQQLATSEEMSTITNSPAPMDSSSLEGVSHKNPSNSINHTTTDLSQPNTTTTTARTTSTTTTTTSPDGCKNRAAGLVCICQTCEVARTRLLHRTNGITSNGDVMWNDCPRDNCENEEEGILDVSGTNKKRVRCTNIVQHGPSDDKQEPIMLPINNFVTTTASKTSHTADSENNNASDDDNNIRLATMANACRTILECIGEDPHREGLVKTPERWAKALLFMCHGYNMTPEQVTNGAVFCDEHHSEMVVVRNIDIHSLCEHHMVPFTGHIHIGYIPNGSILGLSKLARIAELYARRLQVQERLTRQICDAIVETIHPLGVAVVIECTHYCMVMRGVQKVGAVTTTSSVRGCFETNHKTRAEFFSILHGGAKTC